MASQLYEFVGKLMGIAIRTGNPMELWLAPTVRLASLESEVVEWRCTDTCCDSALCTPAPQVWKHLVGEAVTFADVKATSAALARLLNEVGEIHTKDVKEEAWPKIASEMRLTCV